MKKLWGRLGVEIELDDEEFDKFITACGTHNTQLAESMLISWYKHGLFTLSGETYFPESHNFGNSPDYDNLEEELNFTI